MEAKKRLFLGLGLLILIILAVCVFYLAYITFSDSDTLVFNLILILIASIIIFLISFTGFGLFGITLTILRKKHYPVLSKLMNLTINVFFPLVIQVGKLFQITQVKIQRSFVEVNNHLVEAKIDKLGELKGNEVLLLLPHCLQDTRCTRRITINIYNCEECGLCSISKLVEISRRYGSNIRVATGGTLARRFIKETKPKVVLAVACERDLASGILDANPLPVVGLVNERPNGPCLDTVVDHVKVESYLKELLEGGDSGRCFSSTPQKV